MSGAETFFDTSVLLYLLSGQADKADRVEELLGQPGVISIQVLNEFAAVAIRKLRMSPQDVREILGTIRAICRTEPVTVQDHDKGLEIAERYGFSFYDSVIMASAVLSECKTLYSEGLQHGQRIGRLTVINPFVRA